MGAAVPLFVGDGTGSPSSTMSLGPRPTSVLSGVLIHPAVWPQYTNVTERQTDRTTVPQHGTNRFTNGRPKNHVHIDARGHRLRIEPNLDLQFKLECGPMPNVMVALPNIGGALCSTPQSLADAHYYMPCK